MRKSSLGALALLVGLGLQGLSSGAAVAQSEPLHGVLVVKLSMPEPDAAGKSCGLDRTTLEQAFFEPLSKRGIQTAPSGTGYRLFIRATTISYLEGTCVSYAEAQLLLATRFFDPANKQEQSGNVLLWADGGLYASDSREHADTVKQAMRALAERLGQRWDAAN